MKRTDILLILCIAAACAVLLRLGLWQLDRLDEKEAMIVRVEEGLRQPPAPLAEIEQIAAAGQDVEYRPVKLSGQFQHDAESHFFIPYKSRPGYFVYTPLRLADGRVVIVNRGFVPDAEKSPDQRTQGQVKGVVEIEGLARSAPAEKPNTFVNDNDLAKNVFHWKSLSQMASRLPDKTEETVLPFFVDAGLPGDKGAIEGGPEGGVTRIEFPNSHLQYAFTWFGLAAALIAVGGTFLWRRMQASKGA